ncbi:12571_t:CDS:2, partial [Dentiscutata erythropus]
MKVKDSNIYIYLNKSEHLPNLKQRLTAVITKTIVETLPLWMIRSIFDLTGAIEQIANGMYAGKQRDKWCRRLKGGDGWDGYLIAEDAKTTDVGENADMVILYAHGGGLCAGGALLSLVIFVRLYLCCILCNITGLSPEHVFPSARESMLKCYQWLINEKGISPLLVLIGANLATTASLELLKNPVAYNNTPLPSRLLLISPCLSPFNIPLFERNLRGLPKVWICVGGYEVFIEDVMSFVENARNQDVSAELLIEQDNVHNYAILWPLSRHG